MILKEMRIAQLTLGKNPVYQTENFKLEDVKNQVQIDRGCAWEVFFYSGKSWDGKKMLSVSAKSFGQQLLERFQDLDIPGHVYMA